jgi:2-phospho-L-lactate guanylyltransferase
MTARPDVVWAVIPAKDFGRAKSRLAPALDADQRADLARSMLLHVLEVIARCPSVSGVLVATDSGVIQRLAEQRGARVLRDTGAPTLGQVVDAAMVELERLGAGSALVMMADLPTLEPQDVSELLRLGLGSDLVVAPDRGGTRTNALFTRLPALMPTRFGESDSFARHCDEARSRKLGARVHDTPGLALDIDEPGDLAYWKNRG